MANKEFSTFQLTLRELFLLVMFAAAGIASLKLAGMVAASFLLLTILLCMWMAITSIVDRGIRQTFAVGFVLCVAMYAAIVVSSSRNEFDPYGGQLPTSKLLLPPFNVIVARTWIDVTTGKEIPNYDPSQNAMGPGGGMFGGGGPMASLKEVPDRPTFMSIGHVLWALLFGYVGAKFATFIYKRRLENG